MKAFLKSFMAIAVIITLLFQLIEPASAATWEEENIEATEAAELPSMEYSEGNNPTESTVPLEPNSDAEYPGEYHSSDSLALSPFQNDRANKSQNSKEEKKIFLMLFKG